MRFVAKTAPTSSTNNATSGVVTTHFAFEACNRFNKSLALSDVVPGLKIDPKTTKYYNNYMK